MRDGFHQCHVRLQNIFQNVLRITGRCHSKNFQLRVLSFHLPAQVLEHLERVLNRIPVRELIRLAKYLALIV